MKWTLEDEMDWAENVIRHKENPMRPWFDTAIELTLIVIGVWSVYQAALILWSLHN